MEFDKKVYFNFLQNRNIDNAIKYLAQCVPDYLYKFYSLSSGSKKENDELNQKKLKTLSTNCNWYDMPDQQNDPFDMKIPYIDREIARKHNIDSVVVDGMCDFLKTFHDNVLICSFTELDANNLPMWAYYSNNSRGYCVKYQVSKKELIRRIFYEPERINTLNILVSLYKSMQDFKTNSQETQELKWLTAIMTNILNCKHISWHNEKEHRIIIPLDVRKGVNIKNEKVGIEPVELYIGINCSEENKQRLIEISRNNLKCKAYSSETTENKFLKFTEIT